MIVTVHSIGGKWLYEHQTGREAQGVNVTHLIRVPDASLFHVPLFGDDVLELPGVGMQTAAELVALAESRTLASVRISTTIV